MKTSLLILALVVIALLNACEQPTEPITQPKIYIDSTDNGTAKLIVKSITTKKSIDLILSLSTSSSSYCTPAPVDGFNLVTIDFNDKGWCFKSYNCLDVNSIWEEWFGSFEIKPGTIYRCDKIHIDRSTLPPEVKSGSILINLGLKEHPFFTGFALSIRIPFDFTDS